MAMVFRCHQARKNPQSTALDDEIMKAPAIDRAPDLAHQQTAPLGAELGRFLLQRDDAVGQALDVGAGTVPGPVIEEQRGAVSPRKVLLEGENLPPIAQGCLREEAQLGKRIESDPRRIYSIDSLKEHLGCLVELDLGRMEKRVLRFERKLLVNGGQLHDLDSIERPAMGARDFLHFVACFRQANVENFLAGLCSRQQELQCQRRLAGAGLALNKKDATTRQSASQNIVQPGDSGGAFVVVGRFRFFHSRLTVRRVRKNTSKISNPRKIPDWRFGRTSNPETAAGRRRAKG